jgi:hypothetical protein
MLIDELRAQPSRPRFAQAGLDAAGLEGAVVLQAQNVRDYVAAQPNRSVHLLHDLPCIAPLAPRVFVEWTDEAEPHGLERRTGVRLACVWDATRDEPGRDADTRAAARASPLGDNVWDGEVMQEGVPVPFRPARWVLRMSVAAWLADAGLFAHNMVALCAIDADGVFIAGEDFRLPDCGEPIFPPLEAVNMMHGRGAVALLTVCFAHCRNVTLVAHMPTPTRQQRRAAERANRPPLVSYKTLDIGPLQRLLAEVGRVDSQGMARALHLVRAHVKHWAPGTFMGREDAPAVMYLAPQHLRGRKEQGVVVKDYRVHPA